MQISYWKYQVQQVVKSYPNLPIIGITGSYGKTSCKQILWHLLGEQIRVYITPASYNTPIWVAKAILSIDLSHYDVLIVEMWAYQIGDIRELCELVHPSIGILTGITKQHLERFWSVEKIVQAKRELVDYILQHNWEMYINLGNEETRTALASKLAQQSSTPQLHLVEQQQQVGYLPDFAGISFSIDGDEVRCPLLGTHNVEYIEIACMIGLQLGLDKQQLIAKVWTLPYTPHRMELLRNPQTHVTIIDDSYNGNPAWVLANIALFQSQHPQWKKVFLSPGLFELGDQTELVHQQLAQKLSGTFDLYLLIACPGSHTLADSLRKLGTTEEQIIVFASTTQAHQALTHLLHPGDCILFQNDATDNYL